jgi:hypothetical protein
VSLSHRRRVGSLLVMGPICLPDTGDCTGRLSPAPRVAAWVCDGDIEPEMRPKRAEAEVPVSLFPDETRPCLREQSLTAVLFMVCSGSRS